MKSTQSFEELPTLYQRWVIDLLGDQVPRETNAPCDRCPMCQKPASEPTSHQPRYNAETKCCTYLPVLPNFLVGRILNDPAAAGLGVESVRQRIARQVAVTPLGLLQVPSYALTYEILASGGFGHSLALRCPHYDPTGSGRCSIWAHRNSVCTTWFCKHTRGKTGATFWAALKAMLEAVEGDLAAHVALESGIPPQAVAECSRMDGNRLREQYVQEVTLDLALWSSRNRWAAWYGRQEAFFRHCGDSVESLLWKDVASLCGPRIRALTQVVVDTFRAVLSTELPPTMRVAKLSLVPDGPTTSSVSTYRALDTLSLDNELIRVLKYFDGRPYPEVVAEVEDKESLSLDAPLLRRLLDYDILQRA